MEYWAFVIVEYCSSLCAAEHHVYIGTHRTYCFPNQELKMFYDYHVAERMVFNKISSNIFETVL